MDDDSQKKDQEKKEYIKYISERTPWFVGDIILCLIYLGNINQLASGSYDKKIRLWDLEKKSENRVTEIQRRRLKESKKN